MRGATAGGSDCQSQVGGVGAGLECVFGRRLGKPAENKSTCKECDTGKPWPRGRRGPSFPLGSLICMQVCTVHEKRLLRTCRVHHSPPSSQHRSAGAGPGCVAKLPAFEWADLVQTQVSSNTLTGIPSGRKSGASGDGAQTRSEDDGRAGCQKAGKRKEALPEIVSPTSTIPMVYCTEFLCVLTSNV